MLKRGDKSRSKSKLKSCNSRKQGVVSKNRGWGSSKYKNINGTKIHRNNKTFKEMSRSFYSKGVTNNENKKIKSKERGVLVNKYKGGSREASKVKNNINKSLVFSSNEKMDIKDYSYWACNVENMDDASRAHERAESKVRKTKNFIKSNIENLSVLAENFRLRKTSLGEKPLSHVDTNTNNSSSYIQNSKQ